MRALLFALMLSAVAGAAAAVPANDFMAPLYGAWKIVPAPGVLLINNNRLLVIAPGRIRGAGREDTPILGVMVRDRFIAIRTPGQAMVLSVEGPDRMCGWSPGFADGRPFR